MTGERAEKVTLSGAQETTLATLYGKGYRTGTTPGRSVVPAALRLREGLRRSPRLEHRGPRSIEHAVAGLRLAAELWYSDAPGMGSRLSWLNRKLLRGAYRVPAIRRLGRRLRYTFAGRV